MRGRQFQKAMRRLAKYAALHGLRLDDLARRAQVPVQDLQHCLNIGQAPIALLAQLEAGNAGLHLTI
jgi:hypothetical protein